MYTSINEFKNQKSKLIKESIDAKYLEIIFRNIKSELDTIIKWFNDEDYDRAIEYTQDQINRLNDIKKKLEDASGY